MMNNDARISELEARLSYFESNSALFQINDQALGRILPPADGDGGGSFFVFGEKKLYLVVSLREYDPITKNIIAVGQGSPNPNPDDLLPTWDYVRFPE